MADERLVFVVCGPSGVGKSTLIRDLRHRVDGLGFSVSMTTRAPRPHEAEGVHYYFVTAERFAAAAAGDELLEHARVHDRRYGTPRSEIARNHAAGLDPILDIDVQGARQIRASGLDAVFIFILPPSTGVLEQRLRDRHTESAEQLALRLDTARGELAAADEFDYQVVNDELRTAVDQLRCIVVAERCRVRHG